MLDKFLKDMEKIAIDNSPLILTVIGVAGTITTTYLTGKASFKAAKLIEDKQYAINIENTGPERKVLSRNEKIGLVWRVYVLPMSSATLTCAAIVGAHKVSARRMAALAAGYTMLDGRFEEYREKVKEKLGLKKEEAARDEIAQERADKNPPSPTLIINEGKSLFKDEPSGRYFESTMEDIKRAQNDTNYQILSKEYATLTDFYDRIGLAPTSLSEDFGWDITQDKVEISFSTVITQDGKPCICLDYNIHPVRNGYSAEPKSQKLRGL
jgi:hypothetical protein